MAVSSQAVTEKACRHCGVTRPLTDFGRIKSCADGHRHTCKVCRGAQEKERYKKNPDQARWRMIRYRYGIEKEDYEALLREQGGKCAICGTANPTLRNSRVERFAFHIDHDHDTGVIRGLLCYRCNNGIGLLPDPEVLRAAADYLSRR